MKKIVFLFNEKDPDIAGEYSMAIIWWYGILEKFGYDVVYYDYDNGNFNMDNFYKEIKNYKPDFIIHTCYSKFHTEFVKLREIAKTFVIQSDDDYRFFNYARFWIPVVDGVISFCGSRSEIKKNYYSNGSTEKTLMHGHWAFNPNMMLCPEIDKRDILVSHLGGTHGNRLQLLNEFVKNGIRVDCHKGIKYEVFKNIARRSKFSIAFTMDATLTLRQLKGRIFELPYFTVMAAEPFPDMQDYYDLDNEIIMFNSIPEAVEKMNKILTNENEYNKMFERGRKRLLSQHTCYHVWNRYILPKMDEDYKPINVTNLLKEIHGIII